VSLRRCREHSGSGPVRRAYAHSCECLFDESADCCRLGRAVGHPLALLLTRLGSCLFLLLVHGLRSSALSFFPMV